MTRKNILLIDDHSLFRSGLRALICNNLNHVEVLESTSLEDAMRLETPVVDLILLDIKLEGLNGLDGTTLLKRKWPICLIIVLSADDSSQTIRSARERGVNYFLSKGSSADEILIAIKETIEDGAITSKIADNEFSNPAEHHKPLFTPRQYEVLDLLCKGLTNKMIGRQLQLSENTVRCHVQVLLAELNAANRSEAAFTARRMGLVV